MFIIIDTELVPVRPPTIPTKILFIFERFWLCTHLWDKNDKIPPPTRVIPKKKPITEYGSYPMIIASQTAAAAEKVSWNPTIALTTIG